ncbi:uncharacterized protein LOC119613546 isoform X2 [Lucilia sericata]|uniref:uncharacterized protein LOC119613546 isoform X2 n=1 Tax=Lucilia sericata TaxID=13632 RepID=UPI0018A87470|nr:uncharacterized protein LOC119613546 isoform X2 [Lucilia sericata]
MEPRKRVYFLKLFIKSRSAHNVSSKYSLGSILLIFTIILNVISTTTVEELFSNDESNFQLEEGLSNRIKDYTSKIFNITTSATYDFPKNERKVYLSNNLFSSSFIFYTDESSSNLINHDDILQKHHIFKIARNTNVTRAQINHAKHKHLYNLDDETSAFDEDYVFEYDDDNSTLKSANNSTKFTRDPGCSSCQHHENTKKETLESIKKNILMRLQITQPPNITDPPLVVPQKILDNFYKNFNYSRISTQSSVYKHPHYNNKIHKPKTKASAKNVQDELVDEEDDADDSSRTLKRTHNDDIMLSDNRYEFFDEEFSTFASQADEFYSRLHSIYVFPTKSRIHHNRKPEIFNFKFNSDPSRISSTILHIYIKGLNWIYEYQPDLMEKKNMEISIKKKPEITIFIYRVLRRPNSMNYTHTVKLLESRQKIPPGKGQWVEIEIKELSTYWTKTPNSTQSIVIRGMESWMRTFIVTEDESNDKSLALEGTYR